MGQLYGARYLTREVTGANAHPYQHLVAQRVVDELPYLDFEETLEWYDEVKHGSIPSGLYDAQGKELEHTFDRWCQAIMDCNDRFFLLTHVLGRGDLLHPWLFDRCREVEAEPDGHIDLWARFHGKSSIITTGGIIQEILRDPELTIAIFSVNKSVATEFLGQIKEEFENNEFLKTAHPDVCYENPRSRNAEDGRPSKWGLARGITVKRQGRPKEATVEAHGLIDGQPTGRHFGLHVYDDVVTQDYLSELQLKKTTQRFELADNLGTRHGVRKWIAGTRYHFADTYGVIIERGSAKPRIYPATFDGSLHATRIDKKGRTVSNLVLLGAAHWEKIKRDQGRKTVNAQMLLDPVHGNEASFSPHWLRPYEIIPRVLNVYIMVDPSKGTGERSDRTAIAVIGIDPGGVKYLLDGVCHRMKLTERFEFMMAFKSKWERHPGVQYVDVGYERYGMQVDLEVINDMLMPREGMFTIKELNTPKQGGHSKPDRIERLEPDMRGSRFLIPNIVYHPELNPPQHGLNVPIGEFASQCYWMVWSAEDAKNEDRQGKKSSPFRPGQIVYRPVRGLTKAQREFELQARYRIVQPLKRWDENKQPYDLTRVFMEEAVLHPFAPHDDLIDVCSRIYDIEPSAAEQIEARAVAGLPEDDPTGGVDDSSDDDDSGDA